MTDHDIAEAMRVLGGSFAATLGELFQRGDPENQARIKAAWPELFEEYGHLAQLRADGKTSR